MSNLSAFEAPIALVIGIGNEPHVFLFVFFFEFLIRFV